MPKCCLKYIIKPFFKAINYLKFENKNYTKFKHQFTHNLLLLIYACETEEQLSQAYSLRKIECRFKILRILNFN